MYVGASTESVRALRDTFPCLPLITKEDASIHDNDIHDVDTETRISVAILTGRVLGIGSVRELTERKVSPGAFARLNVQEVSRE